MRENTGGTEREHPVDHSEYKQWIKRNNQWTSKRKTSELERESDQEAEFKWVCPSDPYLSLTLPIPLPCQGHFSLPKPLQAQSTSSLSRGWT
jgi:hypothetical protein